MHDVKFSTPERELGKADIEFKIKKAVNYLGLLEFLKVLSFGYQRTQLTAIKLVGKSLTR
jgi:hypothetical protein